MEPDFSGYVTKANLKCTDGRTITPQAFTHMDGKTVPLVWQHGHNSPENILGHVVLEARNDGVYGKGYFNNTPGGVNAKALVQHKDISKLSIYANQLMEKAKSVLHGVINEVSLVLAGANPGAIIDYVRIQHSDDPSDFTVSEDSAIIYTGLDIEHVMQDGTADELNLDHDDVMAHAGMTIQDV
jgi:HK97 family phage prohead protease